MDKVFSDFDWNHARVFLSVAQLGSLTAAAEAHNLSQSTLSRQMAALEAQLDLTLFERVGRGIQLTEAGHQLLRYIEVMNEAAAQISLTAAGHADSLAGKVTVSVSELDAAFRMPPIIRKIRSLAPELELTIDVSNAIANLKTREADIAVRNERPEQVDLIAKKLATETIDLFGSPDYVAHLTRTQFSDVQIIGFEQLDQIIAVLNQRGWTVSEENFSVTTNFQWLHVELAKAGQALIFLPTDLGEKTGLTRVRRVDEPLLELPVWLVSHRELRTNPRVRFVFDLLVEGLSFS
ncbi:MAG: LysR family transcriptional regulator [Gammaproteobacteria bacterium]|nr:LysR family transcriptional regulator [Gammaproteobacteria bacterium]